MAKLVKVTSALYTAPDLPRTNTDFGPIDTSRCTMLDVRKLRYFLAVAQALHFGRAAQALHLAQPALTRQISALEAQVGFSLFERSSRNVSLTPEGQAFVPYARGVIEQLALAEGMAAKLASGMAGHLSLGYASSVAMSDRFTQAIQRFAQAFPDVQLNLIEEPSMNQWAQLRDATLDIGLSRLSPPAEYDLHTDTLEHEPLLVALPVSDTLSSQPQVSLAQLQQRPVILFPEQHGAGLNRAIETLFATAGLPLQRGPSGQQTTTIIALVAAGQGVAVVPACVSALERKGVCYRPLSDASAQIPLHAISRKHGRSRAAEAFLAIINQPGA